MILGHPRVKDLSGKRFGDLLVLEFFGTDKNSHALWICKCDCGNMIVLSGTLLTISSVNKCRCYYGNKAKVARRVSSENRLYSIYRRRSAKRNIEFDLSKDRFNKLISLDCFYCGRNPSNRFRFDVEHEGIMYNGLDRIDNSKGYIDGNVVPCCGECNRAKGQLSYEEFKSWMLTLADHIVSRELQFATMR